MTVFHAKETVIKNVNVFYILAGFEARWSPDCYGDIDVTFSNEINDKKRPFLPCFDGFLQDFLSQGVYEWDFSPEINHNYFYTRKGPVLKPVPQLYLELF